VTRRNFLAAAAGAAAALSAQTRSRMGIATTSFMTVRRPKDTLEFLEYSHSLGAGGIQASLASLDSSYIRSLRKRADELGMYIELMIGLPKEGSDQFERTVAAAKDLGALAVRTACLGGRRYETFSTLDEWKAFVDRSRAAVIKGVSIAEKQRMPFAIENHKDWTADEAAKLMRELSSEYAGVCLDTGNNISLLDEPMQVIETLAPFAISTHLKDMSLRETPDGFDLSEVPFGHGILDLKKVVHTISTARPKTRMTLEMITRNPLRVPCLTTKYWATFPDRSGYALARTLQLARTQTGPLPRLDGLDHDAQLKLEEDNVRRCIEFSARELGV
jgi:sugar phosphate isomerase/epimerase